MTMFQKDYWERKSLGSRRLPSHPVVASYVCPKIDEILKHVPISKDTQLLDVGCGNGFFTFYLDQICHVHGVDYSQKMLEMNPVKNTSSMDAHRLAFKDNSFDVVFCRALLHHVDDVKVLQEFKRVSRKYIVILEPNRNNPLKFLFALSVKEERKALAFSLKYMRDLTKANGLKINAAFSFGMITPNKTPAFLRPVLNKFNFPFPLGMTNFIIAEKTGN